MVVMLAGRNSEYPPLDGSALEQVGHAGLVSYQQETAMSGPADLDCHGGAQNRSLLLLAGDVEPNPGPVWVQYALYHKGENEKVGEALLKLEDQWTNVPREALANWLKHVLLNELANTLVRVDAILVNLEMPIGTQATNDSIHEGMSDGFVNIAVVAPRPSASPLLEKVSLTARTDSPIINYHPLAPLALPPPQHYSVAPQPGQEVVLESPAASFARPWQPATAVPPVPHFTNPPPGMDGTFNPAALALRPMNGGPKNSPGGGSYSVGEKRKRQEKWTEHETLVLIEAKQQEEQEHMTAGEGDRLKTAAERWNRTADIMRSKGVMDREGKNCEDKITNLKKDWGKIKDWNVSHGGMTRYWELSITDRKHNKLPVNMSEAVYTALDEMEEKRLRHRHLLPAHPDPEGLHGAEGGLHQGGIGGMHAPESMHAPEGLHDADVKYAPEGMHSGEGGLSG